MISLIIQREITSIEINTSILIGITIFFILLNKGKIIKQDFELLSILVLIIGIGVFSAAFNNPSAYNFIRDLLYFTKPLMLILLGYLIGKLFLKH